MDTPNVLLTYRVFTSLALLFVSTFSPLFAQDTLYLQNPSFEDTAHYSRVPKGWLNGGFPDETPPDIAPSGFFRERTQAKHGSTYLAMVTRDGGTWERVGNRLSASMKAGNCYRWSIDLARSSTYFSVSRVTGKTINFNGPVVLRVLGGSQADDPRELLAVSPPIAHEDWQRYDFCLCPSKDSPLLILEAMYRVDATEFYGGNLLLDKAGNLEIQASCTADYPDERSKWKDFSPQFSPLARSADTVIPIDYQKVSTLLEEIADGHIDIGLYELAMLAQNAKVQHLLITVTEAPTTATLSAKVLRRRVRSMRLQQRIKIRKYRHSDRSRELVAQSKNGQLQVWIVEQ
jgi:hypothetical protein